MARSLGLEGDVLEDALIVLVEGGDDQNNNMHDSNKVSDRWIILVSSISE